MKSLEEGRGFSSGSGFMALGSGGCCILFFGYGILVKIFQDWSLGLGGFGFESGFEILGCEFWVAQSLKEPALSDYAVLL